MIVEEPVYISAGGNCLFGILTLPADGSDAVVLVAGPGGPNAASFQRNSMAVRLARQLAEAGLGVLRFDYHGVGDSTGEIAEFDLEVPFDEDMGGTLAWAVEKGFDHIGVIGMCFGSSTALTALDSPVPVDCFVFVTMPLASTATVVKRHLGTGGFLRQLRRRLSWDALSDPVIRKRYLAVLTSMVRQTLGRKPVSGAQGRSNLMAGLKRCGSAGISTLMIYGAKDSYYLNTRQTLETLAVSYPNIEIIAEFDGELHGFPTIAGQEAFVQSLVSWIPKHLSVARTLT